MIPRRTATPVTITGYRGTATTIIQPIHRGIFTQFLSRDHTRKGDIGNRKSKTQHDSTIVATAPLPRQGLCRAPGQNGWSLRHSQQGVVTRRPSTPPQRWENLRPSSMRSTKQRWGARRTAGGAPADLSCQIRHFVDLPPTFVDLRHQHLKIKR